MGQDGFPWWREGKRAWYFWRDGRQVRLHADKDEAFRVWHGMRANVGAPPTPKAPTVADVIDAALAAYDASTLRPDTVAKRRHYLTRLKKGLGEADAASLTPDRLVLFARGQPWGRSTAWAFAAVAHAAFRLAVPSLLKADPLAGLKVPGPRSRGAECLVSGGAHERLLVEAPPTVGDALVVLFATGCRPSELASVEARDFNAAAGAFVLWRHKTDRTGRQRVIVLPPSALVVIRRLVAAVPTGPLFRNARGRPLSPSSLRAWVRRARKRLGLPAVTPYGYRHAFATDLLAAGAPDAQVAALLGHTDTAMLHKHYAHLTERLGALRDAAARARE